MSWTPVQRRSTDADTAAGSYPAVLGSSFVAFAGSPVADCNNSAVVGTEAAAAAAAAAGTSLGSSRSEVDCAD